jgi:thiol-disulfide isomerase/thioredoxin
MSTQRTSTWLLLAGCSFLLACEETKEPSSVTRERSQAVASPAGPAAVPGPAAVATASTAAASTSKPRRALCGGKLLADAGAAPKKPLSRRSAAGEAELGELQLTGGYTWVNFWAAWCVPCREEIPRLLSWEKKLAAEGKSFRVAFISLDDDQRQLEKFLAEQPKAAGLRSTHWLIEGKEREDWLVAAGLDPDPELPVHLLVDEKGRIRCRVQGAVEDADFADLARLIRG